MRSAICDRTGPVHEVPRVVGISTPADRPVVRSCARAVLLCPEVFWQAQAELSHKDWARLKVVKASLQANSTAVGPREWRPRNGLKDVLGHSLDEIAALLELTLPTVKAALHRGARLRELSDASSGTGACAWDIAGALRRPVQCA